MVYSLELINSVKDNILSTHKLPNNVSSLIKILSDKVLSPNYSKTPVFSKKKHNNINYNKFVQHTSTKIIQNKNVVNDIKCLLNKLSKKTILDISTNINKELKTCKNEDKQKIINLLFGMNTSSVTFIKLYFELIKNIMTTNLSVSPIVFQVVNEINNSIVEEIKTVKDYDDMCKNNELLDNKTGQYILITYLCVENVIDKTFATTLLENIEKHISKNIDNNESKNLNEYYVKNICKILTILNENSLFESEIEKHNSYLLNILSMCSNKLIYSGLSNKIGFNIMDYCDENGLEY